MTKAKPPEIPATVSFHKRVHYAHILKAIGKDGNYRSNIENSVTTIGKDGIGYYLQQMKKLGLVEHVVIPNGKKRGWIGLWRWCQ